MSTIRRGFLATAEVAAPQDSAHAQENHHGHDHQVVPSDQALRVKALDVLVDAYEHKVGPRNGASVVARAWTDPAYKKRLPADGGPAIAELGYKGETGEHLIVVENTPKIHNLVVCTARHDARLATG